MSFRDFDAERTKVDLKAPGPTFLLGGEEFHCLPVLPGRTLNDVMASVGQDKHGRPLYNAPDIIGFIRDCLVTRLWVEWSFGSDQIDSELDGLSDEQKKSVTNDGGYWEASDDRARFDTVVDNSEDPIELDVYANIMQYLQVEYTGRPTKRSKR